ncbi:LytR/AlgR family response regulator transcription factor [Heyndrickxia ginsengihumi]
MKMETLKVVIADDDHPSRMILKHFLDLFIDYRIVGEAEDGKELIELILHKKPDIALVDINMPGLNGLEAVKICKEKAPQLQVIFTTGFDEFAAEAFDVSAADYVIKPIERTRLFLALEKARKGFEVAKQSVMKSHNANQKIAVKSYNTLLYLVVDEILFIEKKARKTVIHTTDHCYETTETLQEIEETLPSYFYKTHRSFIVNLKKITRIEASGETYLAYFAKCSKVAYISKLKIYNVQSLLVN